jgi:hypothetical protein
VEGAMMSKLPKTDSIRKLAEFWDTHDLTEFEDQIEEITEPVFVRRPTIRVHLESRDAETLGQMAQARGITKEELIRIWVHQKLAGRNNARRSNSRTRESKERTSRPAE